MRESVQGLWELQGKDEVGYVDQDFEFKGFEEDEMGYYLGYWDIVFALFILFATGGN